MPDKLERFTDYARVVLSQSQVTAEEMQLKTINLEHVLVGMVQSAGVAGDILRGLGLEEEVAKGWFAQTYVDRSIDPRLQVELTSETKRLLEKAVDEARRMGNNQVSTGHLLLGLLWLRCNIMGKALTYLDLSEPQLRTLTKAVMLACTDPKDSPQSSVKPRSQPTASKDSSWWYRFTAALMTRIGIEPLDPDGMPPGLAAHGITDSDLIAQITGIMSQERPNARLYTYRGNLHLRRDDYAAAEQDYSEAIRLKPDFGMAYCNRGIARTRQKDYDRAIADYTQMIQMKYRGCLGHTNRGYVYLAKLDYDRAMADFEEALRLKPDDLAARNGRAGVYLSNRELDRAITECDEILKLAPENSTALDNRGTARAHKGEYDTAEADFREVLRLCPSKSRSYSNLGWLSLLRKEYDKALDYCNEAIRLGAKNGPAYYSRGAAKAATGDTAGAVADFRQSLALWTNINTKLCAYIADEMHTYLEQSDKSTPPQL